MTIRETIYHEDSSRFSALEPIVPGGAFALDAKFGADVNAQKVNLIIGAYRNDDGKPHLLDAVGKAKKMLNIETSYHEYPTLLGNPEFLAAARQLVLGDKIAKPQTTNPFVVSVQTVSGTGANSLIARFAQHHIRPTNIWLPDPTWENHCCIWSENAPDINERQYPYYDSKSRSLNFQGMMQTLCQEAQEGDVILLHACAHNPTGLDPTREQWKEIGLLCQEKKLFVVFDSAYQGFASGDLDQDAWSMRYFYDTYPELEMSICQSFSKNMGLYGERAGALHFIVSRKARPSPAGIVQSYLVNIHRSIISMAPQFGARVAATVLSNRDLRQLWDQDLKVLSGRIKDMRKRLYDELTALQTPGTWDHVLEQTGMFSYTGLSQQQVDELRTVHHVYMLSSGRISICGLTNANVKYVSSAIHSVLSKP